MQRDDDESTLGFKSFDGDTTDHMNQEDDTDIPPRISRVVTAGSELEAMCLCELEMMNTISRGNTNVGNYHVGYPERTLPIVKMFSGNHCCVDCGDEESGHLMYGSVGYGTLLCRECAYRHLTNTEEESDIKSLTDDQWTFRNVLALLEGGNSNMLEYIRSKPRWFASKSGKAAATSDVPDLEDVIAFKQIYLSKAARTYRIMLSKKVEDTYMEKIRAAKDEYESRERISRMRVAPLDPIEHIFEMNNISPEDVPGFAGTSTSKRRESDQHLRNSHFSDTAQGGRLSKPRQQSVATLYQDAEHLSFIKEKIKQRRSMNPSIATDDDGVDLMTWERGMSGCTSSAIHIPVQTSPLNIPSTDLRRNPYKKSSDIVGEIDEVSIQGNQYDYGPRGDEMSSDGGGTFGGVGRHANRSSPRWGEVERDDMFLPSHYSARNLGTYRRLGSGESGLQRGVGQKQQNSS